MTSSKVVDWDWDIYDVSFQEEYHTFNHMLKMCVAKSWLVDRTMNIHFYMF
jgi:hypothetical protein